MHDAAVESTNFTECVPATPGESCGSPVTEERAERANPSRCNGVHRASAAASVGGNLRAVTRSDNRMSDLNGV